MRGILELAASPFVWIFLLVTVAVLVRLVREVRRDRALRRWGRQLWADIFEREAAGTKSGGLHPPRGNSSALRAPRATRVEGRK